jgi:hypothetical protein
MSTEAAAAGAIVAAPIIQATTSGHDFWWSGAKGLCSGQHGIPSGMDMEGPSFIEPCDIADATASACDAAMGAINRPATATAKNRRENSAKSFTHQLSHSPLSMERGAIRRFCLNASSSGPYTNRTCGVLITSARGVSPLEARGVSNRIPCNSHPPPASAGTGRYRMNRRRSNHHREA